MLEQSAEEWRIKMLVNAEIMRDAEHSRGPKPNIETISKILYLIDLNDKAKLPTTIKTLKSNLPEMTEKNLWKTYIKFLCEYPKGYPFLLRKRQKKTDKKPGATLLEYHLNPVWFAKQEALTAKTEIRAVEARMMIE
jgi:hypothetical protein